MKPNYDEAVANRFWMKVKESGDCWVWTAAHANGGYGKFCPAPGIQVRAHRRANERKRRYRSKS